MKCCGCDNECIEESARAQGVRFKEDTDCENPNSDNTEQASITSYKYTLADVKVQVKEYSGVKRTVKECHHHLHEETNSEQG